MRLRRFLTDFYCLEQNTRFALIFLAINYYLVLLSYGIIRATSQSLLLAYYPTKDLPYIMAITAGGIGVSVFFYNKLVRHFIFLKLYMISVVFFLFNLLILWFGIKASSGPFVIAFYVWKDIHIVILVEQIWSLGNTMFKMHNARGTYGLLAAAGGSGAISGNVLASTIPAMFGTVNSILFSMGFLSLMFIIQFITMKNLRLLNISEEQAKNFTKDVSATGGINLIFKSRYLALIALITLITQMVTVVIDIQYLDTVASQFVNTDQRTLFFGKVQTVVNSIATFAQIVLAAPMLRHLGLLTCLMIYPVLICATAIFYFISPGLGSIIALKLTNKSIDYSLFRVTKEMLYIPLDYERKYKVKATIDMFFYRFAKLPASMGVKALNYLFGVASVAAFSGYLLVLGIFWLFTIFDIHKGFKKLNNE